MKVDYDLPPAGGDNQDPGVWVPGTTWYCQAWYYDLAPGSRAALPWPGSYFNLSDGLEVQVCAGDATLAFSEDRHTTDAYRSTTNCPVSTLRPSTTRCWK